MPTEVTLRFGDGVIRLTLVVKGRVVDEEIFVGNVERKQAKEVARVLFDDAYDLVSYAINGLKEQR